MNYLFTIVTEPIKAIWEAFWSLLVDSGVTIGGLIFTGIVMALLIGVVTHITIGGSHIKRLAKDE